MAGGFAARVHDAGLRKGDAVVFWSENRPEWIAAFWGCLLRGVVVVPIDYRSSPDFLLRVSRIVSAKLVLVGQDVPPLHAAPGTSDSLAAPVWALHEIEWPEAVGGRQSAVSGQQSAVGPSRDQHHQRRHRRNHLHLGCDGRTQRRRHHAPKCAGEHRPGRARGAEISQMEPAVRADPVSESSAAQPHVRAGHGHVRPADAGRRRGVHARIQPRRHRVAGQNPAYFGRRVRAEDPRRLARARAACETRGRESEPGPALGAAVVAFPGDPSAVRPEVLGLRRRRGAARRRARSLLVRAGLRRRPGLWAHRNGADRHAESSVRDEEGIGRQGHGRRRHQDCGGRRNPGQGRERDARLLQRRRGNRAGVRRRLVPHRRRR